MYFYFYGSFFFLSVVGCGTLRFYSGCSVNALAGVGIFGMTTLAFGLASQAQAKNDVMCEKKQQQQKHLYPVFKKELQDVWSRSAAMDLRRTGIKQLNKNVHCIILTFVFEHG